MTYTLADLLLVLIWAILAFLVQPKWIVRHLSHLYRSKTWVEANLKMSHEALCTRLNNEFVPVLGECFNASISNHMQTFRASLLNPVAAQAKRANAEIEEAISHAVQLEDPLAKYKQQAMENYLEKYPYLAFLPTLLGGDGNVPREGSNAPGPSRKDF